MTVRIISFLALIGAALFFPWSILGICAAVYAVWFKDPYELVFGAVLIDLAFGSAVPVPYYTIAALTALGVSLFIRPRLSFIQ